MEEKAVCYYCGTIYDAESEKCPLCGGTARATDLPIPLQRKRTTEEERRVKPAAVPPAARKKKKKDTETPKGMLIGAVIFLALAVLTMLFFIGDMIGWWPGFEDLINRENSIVNEQPETDCTFLRVEPETVVFGAVGDMATLTVTMNIGAEPTLYCFSGAEGIVSVSETAQESHDDTEKTAVFTLTAVSEGETEITVKCGSQTKICAVRCGEPAMQTAPPTVDENFAPELNETDITFDVRGETLLLAMTNRPSGMEVTWRSADTTIAQVDASGNVTGIGSGITTITAEVGGRTASVTVRCAFNNDDVGAHLETTDATINVGENFYMFLYDANGEHITDITFTVEDPDICSYENNIVTGLSHGTTTITIHFAGDDYTCIVRVH